MDPARLHGTSNIRREAQQWRSQPLCERNENAVPWPRDICRGIEILHCPALKIKEVVPIAIAQVQLSQELLGPLWMPTA